MAKPLNARFVETVKPKSTRWEFPDGLLPGLYLVVHPTGRKRYALRTRIHRKPVKLDVGSTEVFSLVEARERARELLREVAAGRDPREARRALRVDENERLFENVLASWAQVYARDHRSADHMRAMIERFVLKRWKGRGIGGITVAEVRQAVHTLADIKPVAANRLRSALSILFGYAVNRGLAPSNPVDGVDKPSPERSRDRVLDNAELSDLWHATGRVPYPMREITRLLMLTGLRLREVSQGRWSEIDIEQRVWTIPAERAKNKRPHLVPLTPAVVEILKSLPRFETAPDLLFPAARGSKGSFSAFGQGRQALDKAMTEARHERGEHEPIRPWVIHDLRRSLASGLQRLRFPIEVTEAVLGHVSGTRAGIKGVYNRHDYFEEKKRALQAWARHVHRLIEPIAEGKVVQLAG